MIKNKKYICKSCKIASEKIGIFQIESHCYSFNLNTNQYNDFHGSESVESCLYFCLNCDKKINYKKIENLIQ